MAKFFVGQRVRVKFSERFPEFVGCETRITKAAREVYSSLGGYYYVAYGVDLHPGFGPREDALEPILDQHQPCDAEFKQSLDDLLKRTERTNIRI